VPERPRFSFVERGKSAALRAAAKRLIARDASTVVCRAATGTPWIELSAGQGRRRFAKRPRGWRNSRPDYRSMHQFY
jgi:hypothetical protein